MNARHALGAILVLAGAGIISACFDSAAAGDSDLAARIAALEARIGDTAYSKGAGKATASAGQQLGTVLSFDQVPSSASQVTIRTAKGYIYEASPMGLNGFTGPTNQEIFFASYDCSGQGYIDGISDYGAAQGYIFTITYDGGSRWDNPAQFYYVPQGTVKAGRIDYHSRLASIDEGCAQIDGTDTRAYPAYPNDAAVTGLESAAIPAPVTIQ